MRTSDAQMCTSKCLAPSIHSKAYRKWMSKHSSPPWYVVVYMVRFLRYNMFFTNCLFCR